jgi:hypothetical protein
MSAVWSLQGQRWLIRYGDVEVGEITKCTAYPRAGDYWFWRCGFYPGSDPGEIKDGKAATFEAARRL